MYFRQYVGNSCFFIQSDNLGFNLRCLEHLHFISIDLTADYCMVSTEEGPGKKFAETLYTHETEQVRHKSVST